MLLVILSLLQLTIPIAISLAAATYLRGVTQQLLVDLCGTEDRARFWVRCSVIAMIAVPLLLVLLVADTPRKCAMTETAECAVHVLRQTFTWTAGGILIAVGVIARAVNRYIPHEIQTLHPTESES